MMAAALVMVLAVPAMAADGCLTLTFEDGVITSQTGEAEVRTALIYPYLWVQTGPNVGQDEYEGTVSHDIGDATGAVVCDDGSVALSHSINVVDLGDGICEQDGVRGMLSGPVDDSGCTTPEEYSRTFAPENLVEAGVFSSVVLNDDGTVTGTYADTGVTITLEVNPFNRPSAATSALESDAPTIGEVWSRRVGSPTGQFQPI
jgi:hypothetical protein